MPDETPNGPAQTRDPEGSAQGGVGEPSPLQTRAAFLQNWDWESVVRHNRGVCERGRAQHGTSPESVEKVRRQWEEKRLVAAPLGETLDFLRHCHRAAPFLFFNGNTFAEIGRTFSDYLFAELPTVRRREATSAIAGVLDREFMVEIVEELCRSAELKAGDRVKTLRGSSRGVIVRLLDDGRVVWKADGARKEMVALPESLLPDKPCKR
jgi:hypothetical protein